MSGHNWERFDEMGRVSYYCSKCSRPYTDIWYPPPIDSKVVHFEGKYLTCEETQEFDQISAVMNS